MDRIRLLNFHGTEDGAPYGPKDFIHEVKETNERPCTIDIHDCLEQIVIDASFSSMLQSSDRPTLQQYFVILQP